MNLPSNLVVAGGEAPKGDPDKVKYTSADLLRGAYAMLLAELEEPTRKRIVNDLNSAVSSQFARAVCYYVDDLENRAKIEKFLTKNNVPAKILP